MEMPSDQGMTVAIEDAGRDCFVLNPKLIVSFGSSEAAVKVRKYFSLSCTGCLQFLDKEFPLIEQKLIQTGLIHWEFVPLPSDLITIQAMHFFEKTSEEGKRDFIRGIAPHAVDVDMHPLSRSLRGYAASQKMNYHNFKLDSFEDLDGSDTLREIKEFWSCGAYPKIYNYLVVVAGEEQGFSSEPTFSSISRIVQENESRELL